MFEEVDDPVARMRALWDTLDREDLSASVRLENARHILAVLEGLPPVPEAASLVADHRRRILAVLAALSEEAEREKALDAAARDLFETMGEVVRDLEKLPGE